MKRNLSNLKKSVILLAVFLIIDNFASAATFTAVASGNWSSSATWGGSAPSSSNTIDQITIPSGISVNMDNDVILNGVLTQINVNGTLTSGSTTVLNVSNGTISGNGTINIGSVILGTGAVLSFTGSFTSNAFSNAAINLQTAGNFTVKQTLTLASGIITVQSGGSFSLVSNSSIVLNGGKVTTNGGTIGLPSTYNVHYKAGASMAGIELSGSGLNNLTIEVGTGNNLTLTSNVTVNGTLALTNGNLVLGLFNLTLNGDVSAAGTGTVSASNSSLSINSGAGINGKIKFSGSTNTLNNLTVNIGNQNKARIGGEITVNGNLTLTTGILQFDTVNFTLKGGISAAGSGTVSSSSASNIILNTNVSPSGKLSFDAGGNTVNNLTINIGGNGTIMVGSDLKVNGTLNLTNGHLDIGDYKLSVTNNTSITGASNSSYIITGTSGALSLSVSPSDISGVIYPVGTSTNYFPAKVVLNVGSGSGKVNVGVMNNVYAQGTTGVDLSATKHVVDATWMVTSDISSNLNMNLKLIWPATAEVNGFMRTDAHISHYVNSNWDFSANASATAEAGGMYSLTRNNVTSLSPFAVYDATTGAINNQPKKSTVYIYPNPSNETIAVKSVNGISETVNIDILNLTGQVVASYKFDNTVKAVSISDLKPGNYIVRINNSENNSYQRFIKN